MRQESGFLIKYYDELDSTSNKVKELAEEGAEERLVVVAKSQTGGRGRKGRPFFSPGEKGLYMSVLLRPKISFHDTLQITTMTAVAVARAMERVSPLGEMVDIKWVNDLFIHGKKVCGILTEAGQKFTDGVPDYVVVGIGVNVGGMEFPGELEEIATSMEKEWGLLPSKKMLLSFILEELEALYSQLPDCDYMDDYRKRSMVIGKNIRVYCNHIFYEAKAVGIDDNAGLIIETDTKREVLQSGEITIRINN